MTCGGLRAKIVFLAALILLILQMPIAHSADRTGGAAEPSIDNTFWCLPGCRLKNDNKGVPIIPDWCELWAPATPVCGNIDVGNDRCAGVSSAYGPSDAMDKSRQVTTAELIELLSSPPIPNRNSEKSQKFVCIKIDKRKLESEAHYKFDVYEPDQLSSGGSVRRFMSLSCSPGCQLESPLNRPEIEALGIDTDTGVINDWLPNWCMRMTDSCGIQYGRDILYRSGGEMCGSRRGSDQTMRQAVCTRLKLSTDI